MQAGDQRPFSHRDLRALGRRNAARLTLRMTHAKELTKSSEEATGQTVPKPLRGCGSGCVRPPSAGSIKLPFKSLLSSGDR
jgi:hypothetical protein